MNDVDTKVADEIDRLWQQLDNKVNDTLHHKVRGPIATIRGLVHILSKSELSEENRQLICWIGNKAEELELVTKTLIQEIAKRKY